MITKKPKKVEIAFLFESKDDFGGDEHGIEVLFDKEVVATYGDYYHDKGFDKAEAFIEGVEFATGWKLPEAKTIDKVKPLE